MGPEPRESSSDPLEPRDLVEARLEIPCGHLGLSPPPAVVHLRLSPHTGGWLVYLWNRDGIREPLVAWLGKHLDAKPLEGQTSQPRLTTLRVAELPEGWRPLVEGLGVDLMVVEPSGTVRLNLHGPRSELQAFVEHLGTDEERATVQEISPARPEAPLLTDRQREALLHAVAAGYFDVPRQVHLKEMAEELDLSEGALSELLRRGEGRVLRWFFQQEFGQEPRKSAWEGEEK